MAEHTSEAAVSTRWKLPLELITMIFHHLGSYEACIRSTSLVCKKWRSLGQQNVVFQHYVTPGRDRSMTLDMYQRWKLLCKQLSWTRSVFHTMIEHECIQYILFEAWKQKSFVYPFFDELYSTEERGTVPMCRIAAIFMMFFPGCVVELDLDPWIEEHSCGMRESMLRKANQYILWNDRVRMLDTNLDTGMSDHEFILRLIGGYLPWIDGKSGNDIKRYPLYLTLHCTNNGSNAIVRSNGLLVGCKETEFDQSIGRKKFVLTYRSDVQRPGDSECYDEIEVHVISGLR